MPAPFTLPTMTVLTDYEPPKREGFGGPREKQPNPFTATIAELAAVWDDEKRRSRNAVEFTYDLGNDDGKMELIRIKTKISSAAKEAGYSPAFEKRPNRHRAGKKYDGVCRFYLIPKIERPRKKINDKPATTA